MTPSSFPTGSEALSLEAKMSERHVSYVAYLIHMNGTPLSRPRKVIVNLCPKQVIIREYFLKFIPKKLVTYRLSPSTKVSFTGRNLKINLFDIREEKLNF